MLSEKQRNELIEVLETRFAEHPERHESLAWPAVLERLAANERALTSVFAMERTAGEPDVVGIDSATDEILFIDCSSESPLERRNLCYDNAALEARKRNKPEGSACGMAKAMGVELLDEDGYRMLQKIGAFDRKTSSWIKTPDAIRDLGGALFCDRRYDHVFAYHNGAESYYSTRGFRGLVRV